MSGEPSKVEKLKKEWIKCLKKPAAKKIMEGEEEVDCMKVKLCMELIYQDFMAKASDLKKSEAALAKSEAALAEEKQKVETFTKMMCETQASRSELENENETLRKTVGELEQKLKEATDSLEKRKNDEQKLKEATESLEKMKKAAAKLDEKAAGPSNVLRPAKFFVPETVGFVPETLGFMTETGVGEASQTPVRSEQAQQPQPFAKKTPTNHFFVPETVAIVPETEDTDEVVEGSPMSARTSSQASLQGKKRRKKLMRKNRESTRMESMDCSTSSSNTEVEESRSIDW